jgi:hypothetical protein
MSRCLVAIIALVTASSWASAEASYRCGHECSGLARPDATSIAVAPTPSAAQRAAARRVGSSEKELTAEMRPARAGGGAPAGGEAARPVASGRGRRGNDAQAAEASPEGRGAWRRA